MKALFQAISVSYALSINTTSPREKKKKTHKGIRLKIGFFHLGFHQINQKFIIDYCRSRIGKMAMAIFCRMCYILEVEEWGFMSCGLWSLGNIRVAKVVVINSGGESQRNIHHDLYFVNWIRFGFFFMNSRFGNWELNSTLWTIKN